MTALLKQVRRRAGATNDDGAILVMVLLFVLVVGLITGAVVTQVTASVGNTVVLRGKVSKVYGADAGIDYALNMMRTDSTLCPETGDTQLIATRTFNGRQVDIRCNTLSGSANGAFGYAVVTTDPNAGGLDTSGGGDQTVKGPVYASSMPNSIKLTVRNGNVRRSQADCTTATKPGNLVLIPSPPYQYTCTSASYPDPKPNLPATVPGLAPLPKITGSCTTFFPGMYVAALPLNQKNYFVSGVYLFSNIVIDVGGGTEIIGGRQGATEPKITSAIPCSNDSAAAVTPTGTGVEWILGGTSRMHVDNQPGTTVELFRRAGGVVATEGTQGISFRSVRLGSGLTVPAVWLPHVSTLTATSLILDEDSGNNPAFSVHGLTYVPNAKLNLNNVSNGSQAVVRGGIVAARIMLQSSASGGGLGISIETGEDPREVVLTATAKGVNSTDKDITATAVVNISNDDPRQATVTSWRTDQEKQIS
jgi:hypothetical protein